MYKKEHPKNVPVIVIVNFKPLKGHLNGSNLLGEPLSSTGVVKETLFPGSNMSSNVFPLQVSYSDFLPYFTSVTEGKIQRRFKFFQLA